MELINALSIDSDNSLKSADKNLILRLIKAVKNGDLEAVNSLIEAGADVNTRDE